MADVLLTRSPLDVEPLRRSIQSEEMGGSVIFLGDVRSPNAGQVVYGIEYEAYEPMAQKELARIGEEAERRWAGRCAVAHRLGLVKAGECSVAVVFAAAHRAEAFEACRWVIDSLKETAPIWKREMAADGEVWIEGPHRIPRR
jgi:molybdopterin synthase catalytic subunit